MGKFDEIMKVINEKYEGKYVAVASDTSAFEIERLPTGILAVDGITYGGLPLGKIIIFWGEWSSAKTFTALKASARAQRTCRKCLGFMRAGAPVLSVVDQNTGTVLMQYGDAQKALDKIKEMEDLTKLKNTSSDGLDEEDEKTLKDLRGWYNKSKFKGKKLHAQTSWSVACPQCGGKEALTAVWIAVEDFDPSFAAMAGVDLTRLLVARAEYAEQAIDISAEIVRSGKCDLMVVDSIAALAPSAEIANSAEKWQQGLTARLLNKALRRWAAGQTAVSVEGEEGTRKPTIILINQVRQKIGVIYGSPDVRPGGKGQDFANSLLLKFRGGKYQHIQDTGETTARLITVRAEKAKCCVDAASILFLPAAGRFIPIARMIPEKYVLSLEKQAISPHKVSHVMSIGKKPALRVSLEGGRELVCSGDHEFLMWDKWVAAESLVCGDFVAVPRSVELVESAGLSSRGARLIGYLLGDGYVGGKTPITLINNSCEIGRDFAICVKGLFGYAVRQRKKEVRGLEWIVTRRHGPENKLRTWLRRLGMYGKRAWEKEMPPVVFLSTPRIRGYVVGAYLATDGWVSVEKGWLGASVGFSSTSEALLEGVRMLLLSDGIMSTMKKRVRIGKRVSWELEVSARDDVIKLADFLRGSNAKLRVLRDVVKGLRESGSWLPGQSHSQQLPPEAAIDVKVALKVYGITIKQLAKARGWQGRGSLLRILGAEGKRGHSLKRRNVEHALSFCSGAEGVVARSLGWVRVTSIIPIGERQMYDLSVPGAENYVVNGILTHNCPPGEESEFVMWFRNYKEHKAGSTSEPEVVMGMALQEGIIERDKNTYTLLKEVHKSQKSIVAALTQDDMLLEIVRDRVLSAMSERRLRNA